MKELMLFRHAKSSWADPGQQDRDRPLNARGRRGAALMAGWMRESGWRPDLVLCSSSARTRETIAIVMQTLPVPALLTEDALYLADAEALKRRIAQVPETCARLMIVAHNPGIETLARALDRAGAEDGSGPHAKYPTAGAAWFRADAPAWKRFTAAKPELVAFRTPAMLDDVEDD